MQGIRSLISYEGTTAKKLIKDFHDAVDEYLESCVQEGIEPETAYKGSFNVRIEPRVHHDAVVYAINHSQSLNSVVEEAIETLLYK